MEQIGSLPQCAFSIQAFHYLRIDVDNTQLSLSAFGLTGNVIDNIVLTPPPVLNGVLSVGDSTSAIAAGSLASVFGQNLVIRGAAGGGDSQVPTQLGGVTVTANGIPVPLLYASPSQINIQVPYEVSGQVTLQINTPNGSAATGFHASQLAPSIIAVASQNALCSPSNPAISGGQVTIYATGLGPASTPVATGQRAPMAPNPMVTPVQVRLDDQVLTPSYAGLAPGFSGLGPILFT
jgi:uncharacterized protein (TIGR03437 family)